MKITRFARLACLLQSAIIASHSAPDTVSTAFNDNAADVYRNNVDDFGSVASLLVLPDGSLLVGSNEMATTLEAPNNLQAPLLRFNPDGTVGDNFFADDDANGEGEGIVFVGSGWPEVMALGRQSDGKIIAGGVMTGMNDSTTNVVSRSIVRINTDGTPDDSFQTEGTIQTAFLNYINHLIIDPDDKIVVAGGFRGIRDKGAAVWTRRAGVARLNADGSLDSTFDIDPTEFGVPAAFASFVNAIIYQVERDASGRYYIVGEFSGFGVPVQVFARLFPDGSRDFSFAPNLPEARWNSVALDSQGRITVTGLVDFNPTVAYRLFPDGSIDPTFNLAAGLGAFQAQPLEIDSAGRFIYRNGASLGRILADGSVDPTFTPTASWVNWATSPSFNLGTVAPDGSIYAGGFFDHVEGSAAVKLVRFEGDPVPDALLLDRASVSAVESAGTLYLGVTRVGSAAGAASVDLATVAGSALAGVDFTATSSTLSWAAGETDTKYLAIPLIDNGAADGEKAFSVSLSNATGAPISGAISAAISLLDDEAGPSITQQPVALEVKEGSSATFTAGVNSVSPVTFQWFKDDVEIPGATSINYTIAAADADDAADYSVEVTASGVTIPSSAAALTVIPPKAAPDPAFTAPSLNYNTSVVFNEDGGFLTINGDFSGNYTVTPHAIDGTPATPWPVITTDSSSGLSLIPLSDGKFIATGFFTQFNGQPRRGIARLNANGSLDTTFVPFTNGSFVANGFSTTLNSMRGIQVTADGTVYAMIRTATQGTRLYRFLDDGAIDPTVDTSYNYSTNGRLSSLTQLADGSILVGLIEGSGFSPPRGIRRILPDGTFAPGFPLYTTSFLEVTRVLALDDERFLAIYGNTLSVHDLSDGSLIHSHSFSGTLTDVEPFRGRFLVTGPTAFDGTSLPGLGLFSLDGTVDDNFPGGSGPNDNVSDSKVLADGSIFARGNFTTWNGTAASGMVHLLVEGAEIGFATLSTTAQENTGAFSVELVRYGDASGPASVSVTSSPDSATSPADFAAVDQVISWAAGDASPKTVSITLVDDADIEGDESFTLSLSEASGAEAIPGSLTITLRDDDSLPQITAQPADADSLDGGIATFSVTATSPSAITYQWLFDGEVISGATSDSLTIDPVSSSEEGNYSVVLTNDYGTVTSATASLTIIEDPTDVIAGFNGVTLNDRVLAITAAPDGGAYVGGEFTDVGGDTSRDYLIKVNADGSLDTSFSPVLNDDVYDIALQPDGKVLAAGDFTGLGVGNARGVARFNPDGSLDAAFMANVGTGSNRDLRAVAILDDGDIAIGGGTSFNQWNGSFAPSSRVNIARLNSDGTFDGFYANTSFNTARDILPLPDGKILVAFDTSSFSQLVRRYNNDFTLDNTFSYSKGGTEVNAMALAADGSYLFAEDDGLFRVATNGTPEATLKSLNNSFFRAVAVQLNGKVVGGSIASPRVDRFLANDSPDPVFAPGTGDINNAVRALAITQSGIIWVGGDFTGTAGSRLVALKGDPIPLAIIEEPLSAALNPGDTLNLTGNAIGTTAITYQWFKDGAPLADDGRITGAATAALTITALVEGDEGNYTFTATNDSGTETSESAFIHILGAPEILSLSGDVSMLEGNPLTLEVEATGAATLTYQWFRGATLLPGQTDAALSIAPTSLADSGSYTVEVSNSLDTITSDPIQVEVLPNAAAFAPGFAAPTVTGGAVETLLPLPGARVLVGGDFSSISDGVNTSGARLAVVDESGSIIPVANLEADGKVNILRLQADGKVLVGGNFNSLNGVSRSRVGRLEADLSLDSSFTATGPGFGQVLDLAEEASGTILLGGDFFQYNEQAGTSYAVRLNSDGSYNSSFASGSNSWITRVFAQADDKAILGGWFSAYPGTSDNYLIRVNADGSHDATIDYDTGFFAVSDALQLSNGEILISNAFNSSVLRLASDGSRVTPFPASGGFSGAVRAFAESSTGSLLIGGDFTFAAGSAAGRLVRLDSSGMVESDFDTSIGFNGLVQDIAVSPNGGYWIGGSFTTYNGVEATGLVLLKGDMTDDSGPTPAEVLEDFLANAGVPSNQRGLEDDWDGDNIPNVIELLYMLDPAAIDTIEIATPVSSESGSALNSATASSDFDVSETYFTFSILLPTDLQGFSLEVQASSDLSDFLNNLLATRAVGSPAPSGSGFETATHVIESPMSSTPSAFVRIRVTE